MVHIAILGAGVMASALAITAASNPNNRVYLVGSPLDDAIIDSIINTRWHPTLKCAIPDTILAIHERALTPVLKRANIIVIGVSSAGVAWAARTISSHQNCPGCIALLTKGLVASSDPNFPPLTYATALNSHLDNKKLLGIGGPCIARELALEIPTSVTFAATRIELAREICQHFQTDNYRISVHPDFIGLEACAALKNFYCIGVSAMLEIWKVENVTSKNPLAALFNQAVLEMVILSDWIRQSSESDEQLRQRSGWNEVANDLPGMGDLHVTVGGGRNSQLGAHLGRGKTLDEIIAGPMKGVTVEGIDTGKQLLNGFNLAIDNGVLPAESLPLSISILKSIEHDAQFEFDFTKLPTQA